MISIEQEVTYMVECTCDRCYAFSQGVEFETSELLDEDEVYAYANKQLKAWHGWRMSEQGDMLCPRCAEELGVE